MIADNEEPGSFIPNKRDIIFKWAVLLIGINSVKPWIKPYRKNSKYSKKLYEKLTHILIALKNYNLHLWSKS